MQKHWKIIAFFLLPAPCVIGCNLRKSAPEWVELSHRAVLQNQVRAELVIESAWESGYCATVVVQNETGKVGESWRVVSKLNGGRLTQIWNTQVLADDGKLTFLPEDWNANIKAGKQGNQAGFCATWGTSKPEVLSVWLLEPGEVARSSNQKPKARVPASRGLVPLAQTEGDRLSSLNINH
jgi:Cellulose binding domain